MTDDEFRAMHESIIKQYPEAVQRELRTARERWMATNRRLKITTINDQEEQEYRTAGIPYIT